MGLSLYYSERGNNPAGYWAYYESVQLPLILLLALWFGSADAHVPAIAVGSPGRVLVGGAASSRLRAGKGRKERDGVVVVSRELQAHACMHGMRVVDRRKSFHLEESKRAELVDLSRLTFSKTPVVFGKLTDGDRSEPTALCTCGVILRTIGLCRSHFSRVCKK